MKTFPRVNLGHCKVQIKIAVATSAGTDIAMSLALRQPINVPTQGLAQQRNAIQPYPL